MNKGFIGFVVALSLLVIIAVTLGSSDPISPAIIVELTKKPGGG